jgi:hypothetical protein
LIVRANRLALAGLLAALATTGCASRQAVVRAAAPACPIRGIIYVADGAGDFEGTSDNLREAIATDGWPLHVETFDWSHGYLRVLADHVDQRNAREAAQGLAAQITAWQGSPQRPELYLVGHSAGANVTLAAADYLPPNSVDRIVLLAPAVAADYDLRPALRAARQGVDVFYSERDWFILGLTTRMFGTSDGRRGSPAAGRTGFAPFPLCPEDAALYAKLHQHPWDPCLRWTGNRGGHYGSYDVGFLRAYVLPVMASK